MLMRLTPASANYATFTPFSAGRTGAPLTSHSFDKNLKAYAERVGVEDARIHRTRHTFARIVHEESGSLIEVLDALDYKDLGTTGVYIDRLVIKCDKHSRQIAERVRSTSISNLGEGTHNKG